MGIFAEAVHACAELLSESGDAPEVARGIEVGAPDRAALLVAFVDELVYLAETEDLAPGRMLHTELGEDRLTARVAFTATGPRHLIKGATYHRLAFEPTPGGYRATVVLDV